VTKSPPIQMWLRDAILQFCNELPKGVAELRIKPNQPATVFAADIIPRSTKASRISVAAEEGEWEALVAFGSKSQLNARYYDRPDADRLFKEEVLKICRSIADSHWQERVLLRGDRVVKCWAMLPSPIGRVRTPGVWLFLPLWKKKTEKVIDWEPYVCNEHGVPEKRS